MEQLQSQISFYGTIFTVQGMRPDPAKVQALQDLPAPQNPKFGCQDHLPKGASNQLGLEPLH